jgi:hypothetical protein
MGIGEETSWELVKRDVEASDLSPARSALLADEAVDEWTKISTPDCKVL